MKLLEPTVEFHGPAAQHDMPCAVYREKHAVLDCNRGVFMPSWNAQADGWHLVCANTWWRRLLVRAMVR